VKPSRRDLLTSLAAGLLAGANGRALGQSTSPGRKLIVVWANGGWDVTYTFDPKLGVDGIEGPEFFDDPSNPADRNEITAFGDLSVVTNDLRRPNVSAFFQQYQDRCAIVNGVWVGSIAHDPCKLRMLTGTVSDSSADVAVIVGAENADTLPLGSVDLSGFSFAGPLAATAGRIGESSQIVALLDPTRSFPPLPGSGVTYPQFVSSSAEVAAIRDLQATRLARLQQRWAGADDATAARLADFLTSIDRSRRFGEDAKGILDTLELGAQPSVPSMAGIATDLLAQGICQTVIMDSNGRWDTHVSNDSQNGLFNDLFLGLQALMADIDAKGLADSTTVVVMSEMTRTPKHNLQAGKDHWQHTSMMMVGAGVRHGQYGGTTDLLESIPMDLASGETSENGELCKYENLIAGILTMCGVDSEKWLPGANPLTGPMA
jgi:hypothetical protein